MSGDAVDWLTAPEHAAWIGLIKLSALLTTVADQQLRRHGVTGRDYEMLHHLSETSDGLRVNELAALIDDSSSCITHRINRLRGAGLVDKQRDPLDQRARRIRLTDTGRSLLTEIAPDHVRWVRRSVIDALSPRDLADIVRITTQLNEHLRRTSAASTEEAV